MAISWAKASYGGTASKSGGGKLDKTTTEGNKGIPPVSGVSKSNIGKSQGIDTPTTKGNKGVTTK
jgi:hypothetical protein